MDPINFPWPFKAIDGARIDFVVTTFVDAEAVAVSANKSVKRSRAGRVSLVWTCVSFPSST
jgi:hypothetical protein